jgi:hypothetical protein
MNLKIFLKELKERKVMVILNNRCSKCHLSLIYEEQEDHICFSGIAKDVIIDSSKPHMFLIFDGNKWHKCSVPNTNRRVTRQRFNREGNSTILWVLFR